MEIEYWKRMQTSYWHILWQGTSSICSRQQCCNLGVAMSLMVPNIPPYDTKLARPKAKLRPFPARGHTRWGHTRWGHTRWGHTRWGHTRWGHTRWGNTRRGNTRWGNTRRGHKKVAALARQPSQSPSNAERTPKAEGFTRTRPASASAAAGGAFPKLQLLLMKE